MTKETIPQTNEALEQLYAQLPPMQCQGKCQASCTPIVFSRLEGERIRQAVGSVPLADSRLTCLMLRDGRCSIYRLRPLLCRTWGLTPTIRCPHGCEPERWLTEAEFHELIERVMAIGGGIDPAAERQLEQLLPTLKAVNRKKRKP